MLYTASVLIFEEKDAVHFTSSSLLAVLEELI